MTGQNVTNLVTVLIQLVVHIQNRPARIPEDGVYALLLQALDYNLCSCFLHILFF